MNANPNPDVAAALGETASSGVGDTTQAPKGAATSIDPVLAAKQALAEAEANAASAPAESPVAGQGVVPVQPPAPQLQSPPVQTVAPNAAGAQPFVNPDPDSAINEPPKIDPATGQVIPVVAPANQPGPVSPQVEAEEQRQKEIAEPASVAELAEAANLCRSAMGSPSGERVATLLDKVAEARIESEQQAASGQPQV